MSASILPPFFFRLPIVSGLSAFVINYRIPFSNFKCFKLSYLHLTGDKKIFYNQKKQRGKVMKKFLIALFLGLTLAGCGQIYDREPVGIGYDTNELKLSPCACIMVYRA